MLSTRDFSVLGLAQDMVHWSNILTSKLNKAVKLVGATISCERCWLGGNTANAMRHNPHVQSYFMATDQVACPICPSPAPDAAVRAPAWRVCR